MNKEDVITNISLIKDAMNAAKEDCDKDIKNYEKERKDRYWESFYFLKKYLEDLQNICKHEETYENTEVTNYHDYTETTYTICKICGKTLKRC